MIKDTTLRILYDKYTARLNELSDVLANGQCVSFDQYQNVCGKIRGYYEAREEVEALAKKVDSNDWRKRG